MSLRVFDVGIGITNVVVGLGFDFDGLVTDVGKVAVDTGVETGAVLTDASAIVVNVDCSSWVHPRSPLTLDPLQLALLRDSPGANHIARFTAMHITLTNCV